VKKILLISILIPFISMAKEVQKEVQIVNPLYKEGIGYIKSVGKELKSNLIKRLKEDKSGISAATFCSLKAEHIVEQANKALPKGVRVYRTSHKLRNPKNKPDQFDKMVLEETLKAIKENRFSKKPILFKTPDSTRVYKPLFIKKPCLKCHGDPKKMNPKVVEIIKKKYPNDQATGFKEGDFRGFIVAEMKD
jgi:hypothetical protein